MADALPRLSYAQGVEDARAQIVAAIMAESGMGYVETAGCARIIDIIENLPRPEGAPEPWGNDARGLAEARRAS